MNDYLVSAIGHGINGVHVSGRPLKIVILLNQESLTAKTESEAL